MTRKEEARNNLVYLIADHLCRMNPDPSARQVSAAYAIAVATTVLITDLSETLNHEILMNDADGDALSLAARSYLPEFDRILSRKLKEYVDHAMSTFDWRELRDLVEFTYEPDGSLRYRVNRQRIEDLTARFPLEEDEAEGGDGGARE
jgi:hypothetical protein